MADPQRDLFSERPLPASPPPVDVPSPLRPESALRWVLPAVLFVLIVAAIAWVSQNLPRGVSPRQRPDPPPESTRAPELKFLRTKAVWDPERPDALREFEAGVEGHYDFPFVNPADQATTLGFARTSCDCSQLMVAVVGPSEAGRLADRLATEPYPTDPAWNWSKLPQDDAQGIDIPPKGGGVVRIHWNGRKSPGSALRLNIRMWMQPKDQTGNRSYESLEVPIIMAEPVRFSPDKLSFGPLGFGGAVQDDIIAYSATRDKIDLKLDDSQLTPPLYQVSIEGPLDEAALKTFTAKLRDAKNESRVERAVRLRVRLREQDGGRQLDQGPFIRTLPVEMIDGTGVNAPQVTAMIKGDVEIGAHEDGGRLNFKPFAARDGGRHRVPVYNDGSELALEQFSPPYLKVQLRPVPKESRPGRGKWILEVEVPPGTLVGSFPEDAVIILKTSQNRRVRVPVVGTAGQG